MLFSLPCSSDGETVGEARLSPRSLRNCFLFLMQHGPYAAYVPGFALVGDQVVEVVVHKSARCNSHHPLNPRLKALEVKTVKTWSTLGWQAQWRRLRFRPEPREYCYILSVVSQLVGSSQKLMMVSCMAQESFTIFEASYLA